MPVSNPDLIGEFNKFYYRIGDFNHAPNNGNPTYAADDKATLEDDGWLPLCLTDLDITRSFTEHTFNDRCSPDEEEISPGRRQTTLTFNFNQLRHKPLPGTLKAWQDAMDNRKIIAILALTDDRSLDDSDNAALENPDTFGFVGNFIATQTDETQPQEGPNTETYTLRPSARTAYTPTLRRIYGSAFWA